MTSAGDRISWSNPRVLAVLLLVFLSGGLSGAITLRLARATRLNNPPPRPAVTTTSNAPSWNNKDGFLGKCKKELNLTPDQAKKMSAVLDDYKMYYQNLQEQLDEVRATGKGRILEILDPEQKQKFEKLLGDSK
jgi:Spy/CpxP family protein refolding chaperone